MNIEKMREEFEEWVESRAKSSPSGFYPQLKHRCALDESRYMISWVDSAWEGWQASREAIEVELPPYANTGVDTGGWPIDSGSHRINGAIAKCRVAIESLGLKVKS